MYFDFVLTIFESKIRFPFCYLGEFESNSQNPFTEKSELTYFSTTLAYNSAFNSAAKEKKTVPFRFQFILVRFGIQEFWLHYRPSKNFFPEAA